MPWLARDMVQETKRHLYSGARDPDINKLSGAILANATSITLTYELRSLVAGSYIAIDLEMFYVWETNPQNKTATVSGAQLGSAAVNHDSGSIVYVNPRFSDFDILQALNADIADLSSPLNGLYQVKAVERTWLSSTLGYDYAADAIGDPIEIRYKTGNADKFQPLIRSFDISRGLATGDFASGAGIFFYEGGVDGQVIRIRYPAAFGTLTALTDDVQTVTGLPASANDIPPLGAAATLAGRREVRRNLTEAQGNSRRSQEVPPGAVAASPQGLLVRRRQRIVHEAARLAAQHPTYIGDG